MLSLSGLGPSQSCQPPRGCGPARLGGAPEGEGLASGPSLPTADTLRELVSSGIQALVQEIKERFTSSLVSVGPRTRPPPPSPARPVAKSTSPARASAGGRCVFWGHLLPVLHLSLRAAVSFQRQATDTCCELRRAHPSSPLPGAGLLRREGAAEPGGGQAALLCPGAACCGPRKPGPPDPHPLPGAVRPAAWGCPLTGLFLRGGRGSCWMRLGTALSPAGPAAVLDTTLPERSERRLRLPSPTSSKAALTSIVSSVVGPLVPVRAAEPGLQVPGAALAETLAGPHVGTSVVTARRRAA